MRARKLNLQETPYLLLQDLVQRFQVASESLERSYGELQGKVITLSAELEREREERIRLERLAAMGEMAMEMAHEIRNPLGSIELYASMLEDEFADQIVRSVRLLNHTVTNILQFGTPIHPVLTHTSMEPLLDGLRTFLLPLAERKGIRLITACEPDCAALADAELIHRMLLNLVLNALRETPTDGTIRLSANVAGRDTLLTVEDTGAGIAQDALARIFDPLFSTRREGCGLGLSIVKRIVDSHEGTIGVASTANGTTFTIRLKHEHNMEVVSEAITGSR